MHPQGGQVAGENGKTMEQVPAERSCLGFSFQVPGGGRHDADVHTDRPLPTEAPDLPIFQGGQEL